MSGSGVERERAAAGFVYGGRGYEYASFGRRLGAALLDSAVWIIGMSWTLGSLPQSFYDDQPVIAGAIVILFFSAWFNYFAICEWRFGQTIGKNALGLRVMALEGGRLSWNAAAIRNLFRLIDLPLTLVGVLCLIVRRSPRRQRLGDRAAKTIVVREPQPVPAGGEHGAGPAAPEPLAVPPRGPTAGDLFGDATEALVALSPAPQSLTAPSPGPEPSSQGTPTAEPAAAPEVGGLPYATWPLRQTVWGLFAGLLLGALLLPIPVLIADPELESHGGLIAVQSILGATLIITAVAVAGGGEDLRGALRRLGVRGFRPSAIGWMLAAYAAYITAVALYAAFVVQPDQEDIARDLGLDSETVAAIFSVLLIAILAPVSEELFFRGMLFGGLRLRMRPLPAALISGAVFGGLHATTGISAVPPLIFLGVALALLYEKTGSLWPPIILHLVNNCLALALSA